MSKWVQMETSPTELLSLWPTDDHRITQVLGYLSAVQSHRFGNRIGMRQVGTRAVGTGLLRTDTR